MPKSKGDFVDFSTVKKSVSIERSIDTQTHQHHVKGAYP